jgi:hypothetical protein
MFRGEVAACRLSTFRPFLHDFARFCSLPAVTENADESHDMYENKVAYGKFEEIDRNRKALNLI